MALVDRGANVRRLLKGYGDAVDFSSAVGCSYSTGLRRMTNPETITLGELRLLAKRYRIPAEDLLTALRRDLT